MWIWETEIVDVIPTPGHNETHVGFYDAEPAFCFREIFCCRVDC